MVPGELFRYIDAIKSPVLFSRSSIQEKNHPAPSFPLNHHFKNENTPANYRDWLDLFYESIHNAEDYKVNPGNPGIKRAVELIEYDRLTPEQMHLMKVDPQRKAVRQMDRDEGRKEGLEKGRQEGKIETAKNMLK